MPIKMDYLLNADLKNPGADSLQIIKAETVDTAYCLWDVR
jgi:hypothetical protein